MTRPAVLATRRHHGQGAGPKGYLYNEVPCPKRCAGPGPKGLGMLALGGGICTVKSHVKGTKVWARGGV